MWKKVIRKVWALAAGLAVTMAVGCGDRDPPPAPPLPPDSREACCARWGFKPPGHPRELKQLTQPISAPFVIPPDCTSEQCGLNGMWLGQGLKFRELHLEGGYNTQGLKLLGVISPSEVSLSRLKLSISRDELLIMDGKEVYRKGKELIGFKIVLESNKLLSPSPGSSEGEKLRFYLRIINIDQVEFWDCVGEPNCEKVFLYEFLATSNADDGCRIEVCDPKLARSQGVKADIQGKVVVFAGDLYDTKTFQIRSNNLESGSSCPESALSPQEFDVINLACVGTAISKLHLMRHTEAASLRFAAKRTAVSERQAMLRMLTADYCGKGHSFTKNGVPIKFATLDGSGYKNFELVNTGPGTSISTEAVWTDRGAACIGQPRLVSSSKILSKCELPPACAGTTPSTDMLAPLSGIESIFGPDLSCLGSGEYLVSGTTQP